MSRHCQSQSIRIVELEFGTNDPRLQIRSVRRVMREPRRPSALGMYEVMAFLNGMARTTTDETTPAFAARGMLAMDLLAVRIHIGSGPCPT